MPQTEPTTYTCSVCKLAVLVLTGDDGQPEIIRGCAHDDAVVHANIHVHLRGMSSLSLEEETA